MGDLITAWTTHISPASSLGNATSAIGTSPAFNLTSIFPERDYGCRIQTSPREQNDSPACRTPIGYGGPQSLLGLIPLNNFIGGGGDEIPEAKVLACVVAVGQPETCDISTSLYTCLELTSSTVISKDGKTISAISVGIRDQAGHATLGLYRLLIPSAQGWTPFETVLLISSPKCLRGGKIIATTKTLIEVDPDIGEAESLRRWVQRENCPVNEKFPGELFDLEAIETSPLRLQFTLASLHSFVTSAPSQIITGYLSVILAKLNMIKIYKKGQLFSMECCGMPIYANTMMGNCGQCGAGVSLRINPDLVSEFADETGAVHNGSTATSATSSLNGKKATHGKVLWSDEAWTSLLGRSPSDLAALCTSAGISSDDLSKLQYLEHRLLWMRVIMLIGWTGEKGGGRLAVLKIIG